MIRRGVQMREVLLGIAGLLAILWGFHETILPSLATQTQPVMRICVASHYGFKGCTQADHQMTVAQAPCVCGDGPA